MGLLCDGHRLLLNKILALEIQMFANDQTVMNCLVEDARQGIGVFGTNSLITRNSLIGNDTGIVLLSEGNELYRNESVSNDCQGLVIIGGPNNAIHQNDFYDNGIFHVVPPEHSSALILLA